ncbi:MAG: cache domain-containing protein [Magnetospirillum sp.]|nr:cache domain-containing protein [Magnetospirillum sp.]
MVTSIAESATLRFGDFAQCQAHLIRLAQRAPEYRNLSVLDRDGAVLCSATPDGAPAAAGLPNAQRPYVRRALEEGRFIVGEWTTPGPAAEPGTAMLPFAVPFRDEAGAVAGVVTLGLDLPWLATNFAARPCPRTPACWSPTATAPSWSSCPTASPSAASACRNPI